MTRESFDYKLRHLFLPMLVVAPLFVGGYTLLNWVFVTGTGLLPLDEDLVRFWLPGAAAGLCAVLVLGPRLRTLEHSPKRNTQALYELLATAILAAPAILAQFYLAAASGAVTHVASAEAIATSPPAKYYIAESVCLAKDNVAVYATNEITGSHDENLEFNLYAAVPLCGAAKPNPRLARVWIGLHYSKRIDSHNVDEKLEYQRFARESEDKFDADNSARYRYFETAGQNAERRAFEKALQNGHITAANPIVLIPHAEPFEARTGSLLGWTLGTLGGGMVLWFLLVLLPSADPNRLTADGATCSKGGALVSMFFIPRRENYGLPLLIDANILVYLAMVFSGLGVVAFDTDDLLAWGGLYGPAAHGLGLLRLISCQFVHGGLMHIASNMYGLLFTGLFLTPVARNARLIGCYLFCGTAGAVTSLLAHPDIVSVGASGAIMGLCGILLALVALRDSRVAGLRSPILINVGIMVLLTLAYGAGAVGIDNDAHFGGLAAGFVLGVALRFLPAAREPDLPGGGSD